MQIQTKQPVKAFDLLPVLQYRSPTGTPTCASVAGNDVYVGYSTGQVRHFLVSSTTSTNGRTKYQVRFLDDMMGASKRAVTQILIAPTIARIIGLGETQMFVGDMFSMVIAQTYSRSTPKSVTHMCVNEASSSYDLEVAVCQSRKKSVLLMMVTAERFIVKQEIGNLQAVPQRVLWHGSVLLLAYDSFYAVYNLMSRTEMELFPYNPTTTSPLITPLGEGEIYTNGDGLGMILNDNGDVCRAPIAWVNQPKFICYSNPYIIGISQTSIQVYSLLDQQLKQKSGFNDASAVAHFAGHVYIVTEEQIYMLIPIPVEEQVERLLDSGNIHQAMTLADETLGTLTRSTAKINRLKLLRMRAALVYFERGELEEAFELFSKTQTSSADVYMLYDTLVADSSGKISIISLEPAKQDTYHIALLQFISKTGPRSEAFNTVEFKLVVLTEPTRAERLVKENRPMEMAAIVAFMKEHRLFYLLGLYYANCNFILEAVEQWRDIETRVVQDARYPGIQCIIDLLLHTDIQAVIMSNMEWLISCDPDMALQLLTNTRAQLNNDHVLEMLTQKPGHVIRFLENLVITRGTDASRYHTQLAQEYLAVLLNPQTPKNTSISFRSKLQKHLLASDKYAVSLILNKVEETHLKKEQAILYGKLQEHDKALKVLVYDVQDLSSAEEYCREWPSGREKLHTLLLDIYLNCNRTELKNALEERAVDFLNSSQSEFAYAEVYRLIPPHWPISLIQPFVYRSLGHQAHRYRTSRIVKGLSELEWARVKSAKIGLTNKVVKVSTGTYCAFCFHPFSDSNCSVTKSGDVYHPSCVGNVT